jgi:hypothetical protein
MENRRFGGRKSTEKSCSLRELSSFSPRALVAAMAVPTLLWKHEIPLGWGVGLRVDVMKRQHMLTKNIDANGLLIK